MFPARAPGARSLDQALSIVSTGRSEKTIDLRTGKAVAKLRIGLKVLAVSYHGGAKVATRERLLAIVALCAL